MNDTMMLFVPAWLVWLFVIVMVLDIANNGLGIIVKILKRIRQWR